MSLDDEAQNSLWRRLEALNLDELDSTLSFSKRLARDNDWSHEFALRVIGEYKRFVFLAVTQGEPMTPSDEVDQAWHLHLTYTHSYWDEMCGEVLETPLHHGPTRGGKQENRKFNDWYARTIEAYESAFGHPPPRDVWPTPEVRFGNIESLKRIDTDRYLMVRKSWAKLLGLGGAGLVLSGCAWALEGKSVGILVILVVLGLIVVAVVAAGLAKKKKDGSGGCGASGGCGGCGGGCGGCGG